MRSVLIGFVLFWGSFSYANEPFDCAKSPGRDLCLQIRRVESYIVDCSGAGCYSLWRSYIFALDELTDSYMKSFLPSDKFSFQVGEMAYELARKICAQEQTGDADWIERLATAENRALTPLKEIQQSAKMPVVKTCKKILAK